MDPLFGNASATAVIVWRYPPAIFYMEITEAAAACAKNCGKQFRNSCTWWMAPALNGLQKEKVVRIIPLYKRFLIEILFRDEIL